MPRAGRPHVVGLFALCLAAVSAVARPARADEPKIFQLHRGWYMPVGVSLGGALHPGGDSGFAVGGEVSIVHLGQGWLGHTPTWHGGYVDAIYDPRSDMARFSVGPEIGDIIAGVDGGYVLETGRGGTFHGIALRGILTVGIAALFVRVEHLFGDAPDPTFVELGLLLKFPLRLVTQDEEPCPWLAPSVRRGTGC